MTSQPVDLPNAEELRFGQVLPCNHSLNLTKSPTTLEQDHAEAGKSARLSSAMCAGKIAGGRCMLQLKKPMQAARIEGKGYTGGCGSVGAVHEASWMNAGSSDDVIFTVGDSVVAAVQPQGRDKYFLIDSGTCENVAKQGEFAAVDSTKAKPLFSAQDHPLQVYGKQYPQVQLGGMEGRMEMTVTDDAESLLSVNSFVDKGHEVHFTKDKCFVLTNFHERMPLEKHGKRWCLEVKQSECTTASAPTFTG